MKDKGNTIGIKFTFTPQTDTTSSYYKVTQTNINKSVKMLADFDNLTPLQGMKKELERIEEIDSFSLVIDNTQKKYFLFSVDIKGSAIPDILINFIL